MWERGGTVADGALAGGGELIAIGLGALAAVAVLLVFVGLHRVRASRAGSVTQRLDTLGVIEAAPESGHLRGQLMERAKQVKDRSRPRYNATANGKPNSYTAKLARDLAQADVKLTVGEFMIFTFVAASVGALFGFAMPLGGHFLLGIVFLLAGLFGPRIWLTRRKKKRLRSFNNQLADMISLMGGALRSGYSLFQAMELAAREGPAPAGPEFTRVIREIGLGLSPEEAFSNLTVRMESEDLVLLVTALNVQREVGGNLVEVLETIATTIRERTKLVAEVRVLTAQQQYSGYMIAALPVALSLMLAVINPSYMLGVFQTTTWCGWTMVSCSLGMIFIGFMAIRKIVDIKV